MVLTALLLRAIAHSDLPWVNYDPSNNAPSRPFPNSALAVVGLTPIPVKEFRQFHKSNPFAIGLTHRNEISLFSASVEKLKASF
jgi:hypothetical protein